ncbi:N-acetylmuramoyl-L-alanine amidase [Chondromyces apiculatus]|uniref:N-acetylmuramoyl-L-alanine amidase n=1 Tax=Chondromyces apiculatus TaxID=51 RepID=UPI0005C462C3|nr:N-acetylmuramoyl-L-alanine amidase [Chondromyces apiculatus]
MVFAALGCGGGEAPPGPTAPTAEERARLLLAPEAPLPSRAETVALADAVAIASSHAGATARGAELAELAAALRVRLYRLDRVESDGREALELHGAAAAAFRTSGDAEAACEAERQRALFAGDLAGDAAVTYRELYLVSRRHAAHEGRRGASPSASAAAAESPRPARSACLDVVEKTLARAVAYRPSGEYLRALEQEGHRAEQSVLGSAPASSPVLSSAAPSASVAASAASPVSISTADPGADLVLAPRVADKPAGPIKIAAIERHGSEMGARVIIQLTGPTTFKVGSLPADEASGKDARVFLDIAGATARGIARETQVGGALRRIRVGAQAEGTRVVLDLAASLYRRIYYLPDPFRIVVDVSTRTPTGEGKSSQEPGPRAVRRVAIDPGHGGADAGAVGPTGLKEKDITLDIAHRVAPILARDLKIETLLTRDNDVYVPLDMRAARANAFHADLFVSIHCNASEDGLARGVQTFSIDAAREADRSAARVAARENASARGVASDPALVAEVSAILSGLNVGNLADRSHHFAGLLQRSALSSLTPRYPDIRDQGVKSAGFYVLVGADMPAVLFETAFISNPEDEARLATADFRQKMADAVVNAIRAFREGK